MYTLFQDLINKGTVWTKREISNTDELEVLAEKIQAHL